MLAFELDLCSGESIFSSPLRSICYSVAPSFYVVLQVDCWPQVARRYACGSFIVNIIACLPEEVP